MNIYFPWGFDPSIEMTVTHSIGSCAVVWEFMGTVMMHHDDVT